MQTQCAKFFIRVLFVKIRADKKSGQIHKTQAISPKCPDIRAHLDLSERLGYTSDQAIVGKIQEISQFRLKQS